MQLVGQHQQARGSSAGPPSLRPGQRHLQAQHNSICRAQISAGRIQQQASALIDGTPQQLQLDSQLPSHMHQAEPADDPVRLAQLQQQLDRQFRPHPQYRPATDDEGRAKQLTVYISHKQHWSQLLNTWLDNAADFSPFHLTAALCRLSQLACRDGISAADRPEVFKFSGALLSAVQEGIQAFDSRGLAQCLWAYAKLQFVAPHSSSSGDAAAAALTSMLLSQSHMQQLQPSQLSQIAWASATLQSRGMVLESGWWAAVEQRSLQLMQWLKPSEAACCAWALTRNKHRLAAPLAAALCEQLVRTAGAYEPRELVQVMLALAVGQQQQQQALQSSITQPAASSSWLAVCYSRLHQEAPCMSAHELSAAFLALSRLGARNIPSSSLSTGYHQLPITFSVRLLKRALDVLPSSSPRQLVSMVYGLAQLQLNPGPWWWARFLPFSAAALHVCSPSMLAVLAWSLAKLDVQPSAGWMQELLQHSGFKVQGFGAQESTMLLHALGKWRACPDLSWWAAFEDATQHMMPYFTAAELAALLSGMGSTGVPPVDQPQQQQQQWAGPLALWGATPQQQQQQQQHQQQGGMQQTLHQQPQQQLTTTAAQLCIQDATLQLAGHTPGGAWTASMLLSAQRALSGAPAGPLAGIAMGLAKLDIHPSRAWLDAFEAAVLAALPRASLKEVAAVLWSMSVSKVQPCRGVILAVDAQIMALLHQRGSSGGWGPGVSAAPAAATASGSSGAAASRDAAAARDGSTSEVDAPAATAVQSAPAAAHAAAAAAASPADSNDQSLQQWAQLLGGSVGVRGAAVSRTARATPPSAAVAGQLLWAVSHLPEPEGVAPWADDLLAATLPSLQFASRHSLLVLLRSLARLQHVPGPKCWIDAWWQAYAAQLQPRAQAAVGVQAGRTAAAPTAAGTELTAAGVGGLNQQQQQQLQQRGLSPSSGLGQGQQLRATALPLHFCAAAEQTCEQLSVVLWCFKHLAVQPSEGTAWLQTLTAVTQPLLHQLSGLRFRLLLAQFEELGMWPGEAWLSTAEAVLVQHGGRMPPQRIQWAAGSLRRLGWGASRPVRRLLRQCARVVQRSRWAAEKSRRRAMGLTACASVKQLGKQGGAMQEEQEEREEQMPCCAS